MEASKEDSGSGGGEGIVVCFGEMLVDFVSTVSGVSLAESPSFVKAPGGAPANVSISVSKLGGRSAFIGKLGDDEFGRMLSGVLRDNGVSVSGVRFEGVARTALAFVSLRSDGEREFMFYRHPSADMLLSPAELDLELIRRKKRKKPATKVSSPATSVAKTSMAAFEEEPKRIRIVEEVERVRVLQEKEAAKARVE
ncbi:putative fructokinase-3 [Platanthera guangdongensis]|uniref:Fructokinase-3 n=1 Tax=Platanthera guangdongensis TaxID=2320717 RepID=A0ABR2M515_9ASPA